MTVFVSLFRAVNVGGNKVTMVQLKEMHERLGFKNSRHYLQTGNVVFEIDEKDSAKVAGELKKEFAKEFGFSTEVMVRTTAEMKKIVARNPWPEDESKQTKWLVVMFLNAESTKENQEALTSFYKGPEELVFSGEEMFAYYAEGIGESKLTIQIMERKLKVLGTGRNWNTVTKLLAMMDTEASSGK